MSNFETFQPPKVADESTKHANQACQREAHDRAVPSLIPQSQPLPAEFGNFSISHLDENHTAIQAGITDNHVITPEEQETRDRCYQPIPHLPYVLGMNEAKQELNSNKLVGFDRTMLALESGDVEAYTCGNGAIDLADFVTSPGPRFGNFLANLIMNPELAVSDTRGTGETMLEKAWWLSAKLI